MKGYTLTLTSEKGSADSVQINGGVTLSNSSNIVIKDLSFVTTGTGVSFANGAVCDNVLIRDCKFTNSGTSGTAINRAYRDNFSGGGYLPLNDVRIINNIITGGANGIILGGSPARGNNNVIDSNVITDINSGGINVEQLSCNSISHNIVVSRSTVPNVWRGIQLMASSGDVVGNHIRMRAANSSTNAATALMLQAHSTNSGDATGTDTALVANNEMIVRANGQSWDYANICVGLQGARVKFLHNSLYFSGTKPAWGINLENADQGIFKHNNIVLNGS
jgi:hypothetical protein